jgi:hypothetical protein
MACSSISSLLDEEDEHQTQVMDVANARHEAQLPAFTLHHTLSHDDSKAQLSESSSSNSPQQRHSTKQLVDDDIYSSSESNDGAKKPPTKSATKKQKEQRQPTDKTQEVSGQIMPWSSYTAAPAHSLWSSQM